MSSTCDGKVAVCGLFRLKRLLKEHRDSYRWGDLLKRMSTYQDMGTDRVEHNLPATTICIDNTSYHIHGVPCHLSRRSYGRVRNRTLQFVRNACENYRDAVEQSDYLADQSTFATYGIKPYIPDRRHCVLSTALTSGSETLHYLRSRVPRICDPPDPTEERAAQNDILTEVFLAKYNTFSDPSYVSRARSLICLLYEAPLIDFSEPLYLLYAYAFFRRSQYVARKARDHASAEKLKRLHLLVVFEREPELSVLLREPEYPFYKIACGIQPTNSTTLEPATQHSREA